MNTLEIFLTILLCIGAIQGIVYGCILWQKKVPNYIANRFLASILLFFSYRLLVETLKIFGLGRYDVWYHILLEYNWVYGTLIYFFVKSYVTPKFTLQKKDWIHFLPVTIEFIWSFFIKTQNFFWDGTRESLTWLGYWGYVVWMLYPTMYVISGILIVFYTSKAEKVLQNIGAVKEFQVDLSKLKWIRKVLLIMKIFSMLYVVGVLVDFFFFNFASHLFYGHPVFIGMAILTYWLGIEGFARRKEIAYTVVPDISQKEKEQLETIARAIENTMLTDQLFKNPELTLRTLAEEINVKPYLVTKCLNTIFQKKFNDYINSFRIQEVKRIINDPRYDHLTLLALAYEAGFNSKASFNRAVKKITGKSPSYLKSNKKSQ